MRDKWHRVRLGDLVRLEYGKSLPAKDREDGIYPVVGSAGIVGFHHEPLVKGPVTVVGRKGTAGRVVRVPSSCWPIDTAFFAQNASDGRLIGDYEHLLLISSRLEDLVTATGVPGLSRDRALEQFVLLPPVEDQRRIADLISHVEEGVRVSTVTEERLKRARSALLRELFRVPPETNLASVGDIADCSLGKMLDKNKNVGEPQPYLRNANVQWGSFDLADLKTMRFRDKEADRFQVDRGDIVMCEGGEPGRCAIWDSDQSVFFQKALHRIRSRGTVSTHYLYYALTAFVENGPFQDYLTGTTIKHLPRQKLLQIPVPLLEQHDQDRIAGILSEVDVTVSNQKRQTEALVLARKQILNVLLSGEHEIPESYDRFLAEAA